MWKVVASREDRENEVGFVLEEKQGSDLGYRFKFVRTVRTADYDEADYPEGYFDPLNGELDAIEQLVEAIRLDTMRRVQAIKGK